jgi:hypothetical protein
LTDQHDAVLETGVLAQRGRNEHATRAVHVDLVGVADEQSLEPTDLVVEGGKRHEARLDRLPGGARVDQQAPARIRSHDERTLGAVEAAGQRDAVLAGNREAPLRVERKVGHASKDGPRRTRRSRPSLCHRVAPARRVIVSTYLRNSGLSRGSRVNSHLNPLFTTSRTIKEQIRAVNLFRFLNSHLTIAVSPKTLFF